MTTFFATALTFVLAAPPLPENKADAARTLTRMTGVWKVVSTNGHGKTVVAIENRDEFGKPLWQNTTFTIEDGKLITFAEPVVIPNAKFDVGLIFAISEGAKYQIKLGKINGKGPSEIDLALDTGIVLKGIYELAGDELKFCFVNRIAIPADNTEGAKAANSINRPKDFQTTKGDGNYVSYVLERKEK